MAPARKSGGGRSEPARPDCPPPEVTKLLKKYKEVLVIYVKDLPSDEGEPNVAIFSKLASKDSVLTNYLDELLKNLLKMRHASCEGEISGSSPPEGEQEI